MSMITIQGEPLRITWQSPDLSSLLQNKTPEEAFTWISRLFTLCGQAQTLAARMALGMCDAPEEEQLAPVREEAIRETLRRLLTDWMPSLAFPSPAWDLLRQGDAAALEELTRTWVFGESCAEWLSGGMPHWMTWFRRSRLPLATWMRLLRTRDAPRLPLLAGFTPEVLAQCRFSPYPEWRGRACEVSALAICGTRIDDYDLSPSAARLLARLVRLSDWLTGVNKLHADCFVKKETRTAVVETARGWLLHQVTFTPEGNIARYDIVPPTAWHAHPRGIIYSELSSLPSHEPEARRRQLLLIDPCVAFSFIEDVKKVQKIA